jgi:hypothetical protein
MHNTKTQQQHTSFVPIISNDAAKAEFVKTIPKPNDGQNDLLTKYLAVCDTLLASNSFNVNDAIYSAKAYDLPADGVKVLFAKWTAKLTELGKLKEVNGCYDVPMYVVN